MAVHGPAVAAADELDVAVRLVVAAADERRVLERPEMSIDEGPRPVVVDREEDDVSLADDRPDVGLVEELGDRLDGEPIVSGDPGQGLGLVRAQIAVRAGLSRSVPRLEDVAVDEDEERARLGPVREVADERREQLAPDPAAADEDDPV